MLENIKKIGLGSVGLGMQNTSPAKVAMILSSGYEIQTSTQYDWHGLKRGKTSFALFQYTFSGEGTLQVNHKERQVKPGQAILLHFPDDNRYFLPKTSPRWEFVYVCLLGEEILKTWQELEKKYGQLIELSQDSLSVEKAVEIYRKSKEQVYDNAFLISSDAFDLAMRLSCDLSGGILKSNKPIWLQKVESYFHRHLSEPIDLDKVAGLSGYSRFHFIKLFTEQVGESPMAYLGKIRLTKSIDLLKSTSLPIKEIAWRCGFTDSNHFGKIFRKQFGMSAGAYRQSGW